MTSPKEYTALISSCYMPMISILSAAVPTATLFNNFYKIQPTNWNPGLKCLLFDSHRIKLASYSSTKKGKKNIAIKMENHTIINQNQVKILKVIFDSKATWCPCIQHIKKSCLPRINLIKTLSHTSWEAQRQMLLKIHKSLILSKIDLEPL